MVYIHSLSAVAMFPTFGEVTFARQSQHEIDVRSMVLCLVWAEMLVKEGLDIGIRA
jgi:hypothetical protein